MNMILLFIIAILFIIIFLFVQTMIPYPKSTIEIFSEEYSNTKDIWYKGKSNNNLFIMLHGMYGYPKMFEGLKTLVDSGWDVYIPTLPNSSETLEDLIKQKPYSWEDSLKIALRKILENSGSYDKIILGGHSQGGSIAISLAPSLSFLKGIIILGSPIFLINHKFSLFKNLQILFSGIIHFFPQKGLLVERESKSSDTKIKDWFFGLTIHSLRLGLKETKKHLKNILAPTYLIYEKTDPTVLFNNYLYLKKHLPDTKSITFDTPYADQYKGNRHDLLNYEPIKDKVLSGIVTFLMDIK